MPLYNPLDSTAIIDGTITTTDIDTTSFDARYVPLSGQLTAGEPTIQRDLATSGGLVMSSQGLRLTYFTARTSETTTQVRVLTSGTAAAATPTLCRIGLYTIDVSGAGTLVASTANDTTLWASTNTAYTKSWSSSYAKVAGQRYALGLLIVTGAATPTLYGMSGGPAAEMVMAPRLAGLLTGQADLPSSFADASLTATAQRFYAAVLP